MEYSITLRDLVGILQLRKSATPYNLLLTSTVSLTPEDLKNMCGSANWQDFCTWLQQFGIEDRINQLAHYLNRSADLEGYRSLAQLIHAGYFSTVLTTNVDSFLEEALFECGMTPTSYSLLVVNRDKDEYIASTLENDPRGICIVKLRGSLSSRTLPDTFPEVFDLRKALREGVERYLNRDIIIVGSFERENDLHRLLSSDARRSIYYVVPEEPPYDDVVVRAIRGRRNTSPSNSIIFGSYGHFGTFFTAIGSLLLSGQSVTSGNPIPVTSISSLRPSVLPLELQPSQSISPPPILTNVAEVEAEPTPPQVYLPQQTQQILLTTSDAALPALPEEKKKKNELQPLVSRLAIVVIVIGGISLLFLVISIFQKNTPSFNPAQIIILLVIAGAIILGIVGVINSEQLANILTLGVGGNQSKDKSEKKAADDKTA